MSGTATRKSGSNTRGRPFVAGNPGKPRGARHKTTLAVEALMQGEAEGITRVAIEAAKAGDMTAVRLVLDRIAPPARERAVTVDLPAIASPQDAPKAALALIEAAAAGAVTPSEAAAMMSLLEGYRRQSELADIEARVSVLETARARA